MPGYEWMGKEERDQINQVLDTGILFRYEFGNERKGIYKVREFEQKFAQYIEAGHAHAVTSGSTALKVALAALGIGPGDEVITQGFTFVATFEAIIEAGAVPVVAEIDDTLNLDPADFERKITDKTRAVIPVHMLGGPARIKEIVEIAAGHNIKVIEDTAQALGAAIDGKKAGTWGHMGTFSFDFYKTLTTGEGGMIVTNDETLYVRAAEYSDHGHDHNPDVHRALEGRSILGFNYRMNELQGAIGIAQLGRLEAMIQRQKENRNRITEILKRFSRVRMRELPHGGEDSYTHIGFFLESADKALSLHKVLTEKVVPAVYFKNNFWHYVPNWEHLLAGKTAWWPNPYPFAGPPYGREARYSKDMLPQSDLVLGKLIVMPVSLETGEEQIQRITTNLEGALQQVL